MSYLQEKYKKEITPELKNEFRFKNIFQVPRIEKVIVHSGIGKVVANNTQRKEKIIEEAISILSRITGQKPALTVAKKAIAGFKSREGMPIGLKVTLRKNRAFDFLGRLIGAALPRSRDFQGLSRKSINQKGTLDIGIREHIAFPEVAQKQTSVIYGLQVTIVPSTRKREEAMRLYELLGFPFRD